jgi:hypothetical protein
MKLVTTYFGNVQPDSQYAQMLRMFLQHYKESGCELPVAILTDTSTIIPRDVIDLLGTEERGGYANKCVWRYDPTNLPTIVRQGMVFDVKGSLMLQAMHRLSNCLCLDTDALLMKDPTLHIHNLLVQGAKMYMG